MSPSKERPQFVKHSQYVFNLEKLLDLIKKGKAKEANHVCITISYTGIVSSTESHLMMVEAEVCDGENPVLELTVKGCPNPPGCISDSKLEDH